MPTKVIGDADIIGVSLDLGKYAFFFPEKISLRATRTY
jgi:hypothetical protein